MSTYSPYEILGISKDATIKDIKRRYKGLVREFTPEHNPEKFMEIRAAYDMLMSTEMNAFNKFPIYKKPLEFLEQPQEQTTGTILNKALLGFFFETPYNTAAELKMLFKQK